MILETFKQLRRLVSLFALFLPLAMTCSAEDAPAVHLPPTLFRSHAATAPLPEYPEAAIAANQAGRVVAEVTIDKNDRIGSIRILDSASPILGSAVFAALHSWTFKPFLSSSSGKQDLSISGRVVFYFSLKDGLPTVVDAVAARLTVEKQEYESRKGQ